MRCQCYNSDSALDKLPLFKRVLDGGMRVLIKT